MHKQPEQKSSALQNLPHGNLHYVLGSSACPHWRRRWKLGKRPHPPSGTLCEVVSLPDWGQKSLFSLDGIEVKLKVHFAIFQSLGSDMVNLNHKIAVNFICIRMGVQSQPQESRVQLQHILVSPERTQTHHLQSLVLYPTFPKIPAIKN